MNQDESASTGVVLDLSGVSKRFRGSGTDVQALRDVTFSVREGEFVAIMGASGSGKSTLLHLCGGLDLPDTGSITIEGHNIAKMSDRRRTLFRRRRLGIIFQSYNLLPSLTARENIAIPYLIDGQGASKMRSRAEELLDVVHLKHRASHRPQAMSGGEQQRVAIARALMNEPAVLLADEPTGNLDSSHAEQIWHLLTGIARDKHTTVLMVTHEASGAAFADRVLVLKDGELIGQIDSTGSADATMVAARYQELAR